MGRLMVKSHVLPAAGAFDVWLLYHDGMIGHLTALAPGGGTFVQLADWQTNHVPTWTDQGAIVPHAGAKLSLSAQSVASHIGLGESSNDAVSWSDADTGWNAFGLSADADRASPDIAWILFELNSDGSRYVFYTTDGATWTAVLLIAAPTGSSGGGWIGAARGGAFSYAVVFENVSSGTPTVHFYKVMSNGTFTTRNFTTAGANNVPVAQGTQNDGAVDPTNTDLVFLAGDPNLNSCFTLNWGANTLTEQVLPLNNIPADSATLALVTVMGTVLFACDDNVANKGYILRSTDHGATWSNIDLSPVLAGNLSLITAQMIESGGVVGVAPGKVVIANAFDIGYANFLFSIDDGLTWALSGAIGYTGDVSINMKARS